MSNDQMDVMDFIMNKRNGVKGLSDLSLETVPPHYVIPVEKRLGQLNTESQNAIPIIDVLNWEDSREPICDAARKWGFFQIINHGIPLEVLDNVLEATHRFFGLTVEERREYFRARDSGYTCRLSTGFAPHQEKFLEWKDSLIHTYSCAENGESKEEKDLPKGFSTWPPVCRDEVVEYMKWAKPVIRKLLEVLMRGLNVDTIDEGTENSIMGRLAVNLNCYPKCPNPEVTDGVAPHADVSTITVLLQDDIGGLYVHGKEENIWIPVEQVKGALVINIGDVLQIMSNNRYHSVEHRVRANSTKHRVSVPIFATPAFEVVVKTLDEALETGEKPLYKPMVYSDYFKYFFSKPRDGKQTVEYAKI